jgi:hypothetical protein
MKKLIYEIGVILNLKSYTDMTDKEKEEYYEEMDVVPNYVVADDLKEALQKVESLNLKYHTLRSISVLKAGAIL